MQPSQKQDEFETFSKSFELILDKTHNSFYDCCLGLL